MTRASAFGFAVPAALLVAGFVFAAGHLRHALLVYLASWLFLLGAVLGSMALLMIHTLTGGAWGVRLGHELRAAIRLIPYTALAVIPLLLGMHTLFPWLRQHVPVDDPYLYHQQWYLNTAGLVGRTLVVFALWIGMAYGLIRRRTINQRFAAAGLIVMLLTVTIAAVDWVMSLVPYWHSTDIGLLLFTSQLLIAFALAVLVRLVRSAPSARAPSRTLRDFGNLLLVMVMGWAYVSFIDYLTAWIAEQPHETAWYVPRLLTDWWWLGVALACMGFGIPFFTLLLGKAKASWRALCAIAALSLFAQWINLVWLVLPSASVHGVALAWTDPLICIGLLGLGALGYRVRLSGRAREDEA
ncbi:hypothetical protein [Dyella jejuensis]